MDTSGADPGNFWTVVITLFALFASVFQDQKVLKAHRKKSCYKPDDKLSCLFKLMNSTIMNKDTRSAWYNRGGGRKPMREHKSFYEIVQGEESEKQGPGFCEVLMHYTN